MGVMGAHDKGRKAYDMFRDGFAPLALSPEECDELEEAVRASWDLQVRIEDAVNEQIAIHGETEEGEWLGDWDAREIIQRALGDDA
jgi:hypothetical protein